MVIPKPDAQGFECVLRDIPITGTDHSKHYARIDGPHLGEQLLVERDCHNVHDTWATKVLDARCRSQIGWVGMRTGHSQKVALLLRSRDSTGAYIKVNSHDPTADPMTRLRGDLYMPTETEVPQPPKATLNGPIVSQIYTNGGDRQASLLDYVGKLVRLVTTSGRVSVSLEDEAGNTLGWYRKSENFSIGELKGRLGLVLSATRIMIITLEQATRNGYVLARMPKLKADPQAVGKLGETCAVDDRYPERNEHGEVEVKKPRKSPAGIKDWRDFHTYEAREEVQDLLYQAGYTQDQVELNYHTTIGSEILYQYKLKAEVTTPTKTPTQPKETTMSKIAQTATAIINTNKSAAATAGYMEAGRLANNQAAKLASKHLPFMLKAYADTPLGKLVIANVASAAVKQLRPNDATLNELTEAMIVQAFQALYQTVDLDGILDSLTSSPEMSRALDKMKSSRDE